MPEANPPLTVLVSEWVARWGEGKENLESMGRVGGVEEEERQFPINGGNWRLKGRF